MQKKIMKVLEEKKNMMMIQEKINNDGRERKIMMEKEN
jgi:hypothetical protein